MFLPHIALADFISWFQGLGTWIIENPGLLLLLGTGALIPALFWLWLYYRQVYMDREDTRYMLITFFFGMFSVLPVLGMNYLLKSLAGLDLAQFVNEAASTQHGALLVVGFIFMGGLEEYAKFFIIRSVNDKQNAFNRVVDGIEYAVAGALGFAFIENIAYFTIAAEQYVPEGLGNLLAIMSNMTFIQIVLARNFGTMLVHTLFSGFLGYYYGRAKMVGLEAEIDEKKKLRRYLLVTGAKSRIQRLRRLWHNRSLPVPKMVQQKQEELIAEGLTVAIFLHALYNIFLHLGVSLLIAPMIILEFVIIMYELHVEKNLRVFDMEKEARNEIRKELGKVKSEVRG